MAYPLNTNRVSKPLDQPTMNQPRSGGSSLFKNLVTLILVLVILSGGVYFIGGPTVLGNLLPGGSMLKADWQAVFLSNGQVYFGKVKNINSSFVSLSDVYYLQAVSVDKSALGQPPDVQTQPEQRLTLIKMGNEIHGPMDSMLINRSQVVLVEDLKNDSRVVQAINDYVSGKTAAPADETKK